MEFNRESSKYVSKRRASIIGDFTTQTYYGHGRMSNTVSSVQHYECDSSMMNGNVAENTDYVIAFTTCPAPEAENLARTLVESRTCACVNIIRGVTSIYYWENSVHSDQECILMMKTVRSLTARVYQIIREHHSYQVPEFVVLPIIDGAKDYLAWIDTTCRQA